MRSTYLALIASGGALGTLVRWQVVEFAGYDTITVLVLNVVGSAIVGFLAGSGFVRPVAERHPVWPFAAIGVCGGLTTFSTFAVQVAARLDEGRITDGAILTIATVVAAVVAAGLGFGIGRGSKQRSALLR